MRSRSLVLLAFVLCGFLSTRDASAQPAARQRLAPPQAVQPSETRKHAAPIPREALEVLEARLDRAVDRVSLPRVAGLLARDAARGYRLPGYGVVFVLTPRALPGERHRVLVHVTPRSGDADPGEVETLERHVVILQNETEQARQAAEQDMERIVHDLRVRLQAPEATLEVAQASSDAVPSANDAVPRANGGATPVAAEAPDVPSREAPPAPAEAPLPPPPPWKYWFESGGTRDEREPQVVIADVRRALVEALEGPAARVAGLGPEEYVTVAVDFEVPDPFAARPRPERTLVVRARVADITARARAAIDADEFRRRVEALEY
jgi:hypothetical protein